MRPSSPMLFAKMPSTSALLVRPDIALSYASSVWILSEINPSIAMAFVSWHRPIRAPAKVALANKSFFGVIFSCFSDIAKLFSFGYFTVLNYLI